jgi:mono/diheme cytochrome c family protein
MNRKAAKTLSIAVAVDRGWRGLLLGVVLSAAGLVLAASAAIAADGDKPVDYARQVQPLLARSCVRCHGPEKQKSDLRVDSIHALRTGGKIGPAIIPGNGEKSPLVQAILGTSNDIVAMPPIGEGDPLGKDEADLVRRWIDEGAKP